MLIGIIAGEPSGDALGAALIIELKKKIPHCKFIGMAGPLMQAQGMTSLFPMEKLSIMGIIEPIKHLPELFSIRHQLKQAFLQQSIAAFIGIDSPDFNLGLEIALRKKNIPVIHYVSPSVWAWRQWRWRKIARAVDLMLTLFPFEADFYQQHHIPVTYVGHPLADQIPLHTDTLQPRQLLGLPENKQIIALLPGSRLSELKNLSELFLQTANWCLAKNPQLHFVAAMANSTCQQYFTEMYLKIAPDLPLTIISKKATQVMSAADAVLVASGTATLECALLKKPMVVSYKVSALTAWIARRLIKVKFVSLPNLLVKKQLVPEFLQENATVENLGEALLHWLTDHAARQYLTEEFYHLHNVLRQNAASAAADAIARMLT